MIAEDHSGSHWIIVIELKKGRLDAGDVARQLRAGASAAERLVSKGATVRFRPVAVAGRVGKYERHELRKKVHRVQFHEQTRYIKPIECGTRLTEALSDS